MQIKINRRLKLFYDFLIAPTLNRSLPDELFWGTVAIFILDAKEPICENLYSLTIKPKIVIRF
jgi:hypothetical protein